VYSKIKRAKEEVIRLNVEVRRLQTYIHNEEQFLRKHIEELRTDDPELALQLQKKLTHLQALNQLHHTRIRQIHKLPIFSGIVTRGIHQGRTEEAFEDVPVRDEANTDADDSSEADSEHEEMHELLDAISTGLHNMTMD
jgi:hypothetical protein